MKAERCESGWVCFCQRRPEFVLLSVSDGSAVADGKALAARELGVSAEVQKWEFGSLRWAAASAPVLPRLRVARLLGPVECDIAVTLAMAHHPRLGAHSWLSRVPVEMLRLVCETLADEVECEKVMALAMATHPRLGGTSPLSRVLEGPKCVRPCNAGPILKGHEILKWMTNREKKDPDGIPCATSGRCDATAGATAESPQAGGFLPPPPAAAAADDDGNREADGGAGADTGAGAGGAGAGGTDAAGPTLLQCYTGRRRQHRRCRRPHRRQRSKGTSPFPGIVYWFWRRMPLITLRTLSST